MHCNKPEALLDHLVGGDEQARWHGQPERLRRFEVQCGLKIGRGLHRQSAGLSPRRIRSA
jgi:hypothetical protein